MEKHQQTFFATKNSEPSDSTYRKYFQASFASFFITYLSLKFKGCYKSASANVLCHQKQQTNLYGWDGSI